MWRTGQLNRPIEYDSLKSCCVNLMSFSNISTQLKSWEQLSYYHPCVTLLNIWNPFFFCISWVSLIMIDLLTVRIMGENFFVLGLFRHSKLPFHTTNTYPSKSWRKKWHIYREVWLLRIVQGIITKEYQKGSKNSISA